MRIRDSQQTYTSALFVPYIAHVKWFELSFLLSCNSNVENIMGQFKSEPTHISPISAKFPNCYCKHDVSHVCHVQANAYLYKILIKKPNYTKKYTFDVFDYNLDAKSKLVSLEWITQQSASIFAFTALWQ